MNTYCELPVHRWMLRDGVRNEAFRRALAHAVKPGDVVLDMGAGTGILSVFAAAAGARKVYAVERTEVATVARRMVERNGFAGRIEVFQSDLGGRHAAREGRRPRLRVDGRARRRREHAPPLIIARDRWLKPGGKIVPGRVTAVLAPVSMPDFDEGLVHWQSRPHGVDMSVIASTMAQETFHTQEHLTPGSLLAAPQEMWSHDPHTCSLQRADQPFIAKLTFDATRAGTITGFVAWFTADMGDGTSLTNAVGAPDTHWGRTLFPLDRALAVAPGTPIHVELHCEPSVPGSCEFHWSVKVADGPLEEHDTRRDRQARALARAAAAG